MTTLTEAERLARRLVEPGLLTDAPVGDPRLDQHLSGRPPARALTWARPRTGEQCAALLAACAAETLRAVPVSLGTTFWDPWELEGAVAIDLTGLDGSVVVDPAARVARCGAAASVAAVDRAARAHGLCLVAYPDADGETSVGSMLSVGCAAGLGMGRALPVEQCSGGLAATPGGEMVSLGGRRRATGAFGRDGRPGLLSLVTAAQGRGCVITEVDLLLGPAHALGRALLAGAADSVDGALIVDRWLAMARAAMDIGSLDSFRIELGAEASASPRAELLLRCFAAEGAERALELARRAAASLASSELSVSGSAAEPEAARRGSQPEHAWRYSMPPGQHRARLGGGAFWGVEVATSWGAELAPAIDRAMTLFDAVAGLPPLLHRRLGIYPGRHSVSIGVQVLIDRTERSSDAARALLGPAARDLYALGAVPYRWGSLWRSALGDAPGDDPERHAWQLVDGCLGQLDPTGVLAPWRR